MSKAAELAALIGSQSALSNRNLIINGAMQVAQRGTSSTSTGYQTVDRFQTNVLNASTLASTQSQSTDAPSGFSNSYKVTVNTSESSPASNFAFRVIYENEAQNMQSLAYGTSDAKKVTLSFWVKSNVTGTYTVSGYQWDDNRAVTTDYTILSADTWEYKTVTIPADTVGVIDNDNGAGLRINFMLDAGSTYKVTASTWQTYANQLASANHNSDFSDTVSNNWQITGIQLEVGEQATPFEHRSYGDELARCQRYFERKVAGQSYRSFATMRAASSTAAQGALDYSVVKRASPTASQSGTGLNVGPQYATTSIATSYFGLDGCWIQINATGASLTTGQAVNFNANNNAAAYVDLDAEL
jgi:hypothetical protein